MLKFNASSSAIEEAGRAAIRAERDSRLAATDWTQLADVPDETSAKWTAYRQALRDVMADNQWNIDLVVWPEPPA